LCGSQRQLRGFPQHIPFLIREHTFESLRVEHALALIGRHRAQVANGSSHHLLTLWRELSPLRRQLSRLRFLLRRQVFPGFDPVQASLLFVGRQAVEIVQAIYKPLLLLRRQLAELRIALQSLLLVCGR